MTVIDAPVGAPGRWFDDASPPARGDEAWRSTPVGRIVHRLAEVEPAQPAALADGTVEGLAGAPGEVQIVVVNGTPDLDQLRGVLPRGVQVRTVGSEVRIEVASGTDVAEPLHVVHVSQPSGSSALARPRLVLDLGAGATATLVESHVGVAGGALTEAVTTLHVGTDARLVHHRTQAEAADAIHIGRVRVEQGAGSAVVGTAISVGASIARLAVDVILGERATVDLAGVDVPREDAHHDTVVTVDHAASRATSSQVFKAVVADRAYTAFSGHVIVRPGTVATDAHQLNRNLLLARTAQADSRPWLEIFADDVRCDHGSATGRLDEDALFYLRSRGIPRLQARAMLVDAFVRDVTARITVPSVRAHADHLLGVDGDDR